MRASEGIKMREEQWVESIKTFLSSEISSDILKIETLKRLPYAREVLSYDADFNPLNESSELFETDLLIYEQAAKTIKPRIVIEAKIDTVTTHDAISYSYKAQNHKRISPYLRYGIMLGKREHYPLPGRLFRHGTNFDFMISFRDFELSTVEKEAFVALIKKELVYSRQFEEMLQNSRSSRRKRYFLMQKEMYLVEME